MSIYFLTLVITLFCVLIGRFIYTSGKLGILIASLLFSLPMAFIAGVRSLTMGTDLGVYGEFNFRMAIRFSQIADYYQYLKQINGTEYGYAVLNFWVSKFSMDIHWFLFILSLFTLLPFFIGAIRFEQKFSVPVVMQTVFYFTIFYGPSFNEMRQSLAMGWVYLSCSYLFENTSPRKKSLYVLLTWIIAVSFHRTAIIEGVIIFIYLYLHQETTTTGKGLKRFSLILLGSAILLVAFTLLNSGAFASSISKYASYLDGSNSLVQKTIGIGRIISLTMMPMLSFSLVGLWLKKQKQASRNVADMMLFEAVMILDMLFLWAGLHGAIFPRLGQYFSMFEAVAVFLPATFLESKQARWIYFILTCVYYICVFIVITRTGENQIYPYAWIFN